MKTSLSLCALMCAFVSSFILLPSAFPQGSLTPPGAPAPAMKTLDQVEPRIPIDAVHTPGTATDEAVIIQPGSYYLTGNLAVTKTNGIHVGTGGVTIDLNGFQLTRGSGTGGYGVVFDGSSPHCVVKNGSISGLGTGISGPGLTAVSLLYLDVSNCTFTGIDAGNDSQIAHCNVHNNGGSGITTSYACLITDCTAYSNGLNGFDLADRSSIAHCVAVANAGAGIMTSLTCTVAHCAVSNNGTNGLLVVSNSTIRDCTASFNIGNGITTADGCSVSGCAANGNGSGFTGSGISTGAGVLVTDCATKGNKADGIRTGGNCIVSGCIANGNGSGTTGSGISADIRATVRQCSATDNRKSGIVVLGESIVVENRASHNGQGGAAAGIDTTGGSGSRVEGNQARDNTGTGVLASGGDVIVRNTAGNNTVANFNPSSGANFAPVQTPATATNPLANIVF